jgi:hypothetical protein
MLLGDSLLKGCQPRPASMKREWTLAELLEMLPHVRRESRAILSCVHPSAGHGRYVKGKSGPKEFADVKLRASPASRFSLQRLHEWPDGLAIEEVEALDRALLWGIAEGTVRMAAPAWHCRIECLAVDFSPGRTAPAAVRVAAGLAVQNALDTGSWATTSTPGKTPA